MKVRFLVSSVVDTLNEAIATVYLACQVFFYLKTNFFWFTALHFHVYSTTMKEKYNFECAFRNKKQNTLYAYSGLTIEYGDPRFLRCQCCALTELWNSSHLFSKCVSIKSLNWVETVFIQIWFSEKQSQFSSC